jgi:hypothetical protein
MPQIDIPLRRTLVACPKGRLVVRPPQSDGNDPLPLDDDNVAELNDEVQIGVGSNGGVLVTFRDRVTPAVFERVIVVRDKSGLWIGDIDGMSGVDLAAPPGRYVLTGWFDQADGSRTRHVILGLSAGT